MDQNNVTVAEKEQQLRWDRDRTVQERNQAIMEKRETAGTSESAAGRE